MHLGFFQESEIRNRREVECLPFLNGNSADEAANKENEEIEEEQGFLPRIKGF